MAKVLVTGASGFIGSRLVEKLSESGDDITALVHRPTDKFRNSRISVLVADLLKLGKLGEFDLVYHCAGVVSREDGRTCDFNYDGTRGLLEALNGSVRKFVFISTAAVYGSVSSPAVETQSPAPINEYGKSKLAAERFLDRFCPARGLPYVIARVFNPYGPRSDDNFVVPSTIRKLLSPSDQVDVYNPTHTRDFVYIDDVVDALVLFGEPSVSGTYNVGTGIETSVIEVAETLIGLSGKRVRVHYRFSRGPAILRSVADISQARNQGYNPKILLSDGLRRTYESFKAE